MAALAFRRGSRARANSMSTVTPPQNSVDYDPEMAELASRILYKSPLPSPNDLPIYILDSASFPDTRVVNYDSLLPYVLARLPDEETLIGGRGYEIVFFAGGEQQQRRGLDQPPLDDEDANGRRSKKGRPGWSWILNAYQVLSRTMRKRLQHLYLVHERRWVRVIAEMFSTIVSPKVRHKVVHCSTISALALHLPVEDLLIPPTAYERDRTLSSTIHSPYATGRRAFSATQALPLGADGAPRLPRILRETTSVLLDAENVKTEGLFRVNARAQSLEILKEAYDRGQKFILWKEGNHTITFNQWKEGHGEIQTGPVEQLSGYGVHTAAGLTKMWYSGLREPIFPQSSYSFLHRTIEAGKKIEVPVLIDLIVAEWSPLSKESRLILTMHLFPMLHRIAQHSADNKMTAANLAVCFGPTLLCGPDPVEDAKVTRIVTSIIESAVENWHTAVAPACNMSDELFSALLRMPAAAADREDPLSSNTSPPASTNQVEGIVLLDKADSDTSEEMDPPPLPPRAPTIVEGVVAAHSDSTAPLAIKRKPAPPLQAPPRYSTIMRGSVQDEIAISSPSAHQPPNGNGGQEGKATVEVVGGVDRKQDSGSL